MQMLLPLNGGDVGKSLALRLIYNCATAQRGPDAVPCNYTTRTLGGSGGFYVTVNYEQVNLL